MAAAKATTNHDEIRKWVEARGGHPAHVKRTGRKKNDPGVLRIDFPGYSGEESLEEMEWDDWFEAFDRNNLAFLYQGGRSRFSKLVDRGTVKAPAKTPAKKRSSGAAGDSPADRRRVGGGSTKKASAKKSAKKSSAKKSSSKKPSPRKKAANTTTDRDEIQRWVEARGGFPARVKKTGKRGDPGILRIDYPGFSGRETLERIDWEEWFEWFDRNRLAFLYQDSPRSRFSKLVSR